MSRLEFRAWHKTREKYYEVLHLHINKYEGNWVTVKGFCIIEQKDIHIQIQPKDCIIEQYIGLKCLNNVKIFKGDLLHKLDPCGIEVLTVEQLDCESGFCVQVGEFTTCYLTQDYINKNELVVI